MPALSATQISQVKQVLLEKARTYHHHTQLRLTKKEFISAVIAPDVLPLLQQVQEMVQLPDSTNAFMYVTTDDGCKYPLAVTIGGSGLGIPLPKDVRRGLKPTCPPEVKAKVMKWVDDRLQAGRMFGDVFDSLGYLAYACGDARAMTLTLPCLPMLVAGIGTKTADKSVKRLTNLRGTGALPSLKPEIRQRLQAGAALVNSIALFKDAPDPNVGNDVFCFMANQSHTMVTSRSQSIFDENFPQSIL